MVALLDLPAEVLDIILLYIGDVDKARLASTCKQLHARLIDKLYSTIEIRWDLEDNDRHRSLQPKNLTHSNLAIRRLVRTLLEQDARANQVQYLKLQEKGFWKNLPLSTEESFERSGGPTRSIASPFAEVLNSLKLPRQLTYAYNGRFERPQPYLDWTEEIGRCHLHAWLAISISRLQNLKTLSIGTSHSGLCYFASIVRHLLCDESPIQGNFPHLRRVELENDFERRMFGNADNSLWDEISEFDAFLSFLYLPALAELELCLRPTRWRWQFEWPTSQPPLLVNLTSLSLRRTGVAADMLSQILARMPSLCDLRYDLLVEYSYHHDSPSDTFDCRALSQALEMVSGSLRSMQLSVQIASWNDEFTPFELRDYGFQGHLDFSRFENLADLEAPSIMLLGTGKVEKPPGLGSLLPCGLKYFALRDDLAFRPIYPWRSIPLLQKIRQLFEDLVLRGIKLHLLKVILSESGPNPHFHYTPPEILGDALADWDESKQEAFYHICQEAFTEGSIEHTPFNVWHPSSEEACWKKIMDTV